MTFTIRELDASTWDAFAELVERMVPAKTGSSDTKPTACATR
jgi:hypothetical protein